MIITATCEDPYNYIENINSKLTSNKLSSYEVRNFKSYMDWIIACSLIHPSGSKWREIAQSTLEPVNTSYNLPWDFSIDFLIYNEEFEEEKVLETVNLKKTADVDVDFLDKIKERFNYQYSNKDLITLPQKVSASELAHNDTKFFSKILKKPAFLSGEKITGTDIGTAFHNFMEYCNIKNAKSNITKEINILKENGFITELQAELLDAKKISDFLNSDIIERVLNSQQYFREFRFMVKISSKQYDDSLENPDNQVLMQGAVDLAFVENNELVLVDYKTDKVKDINSLKEIYQKQLQLYKSAMEQSTGLKVKEMYIYSVYLNNKIKIEL